MGGKKGKKRAADSGQLRVLALALGSVPVVLDACYDRGIQVYPILANTRFLNDEAP